MADLTRREWMSLLVLAPLVPLLRKVTRRDAFPTCTTSPCSCYSTFHYQEETATTRRLTLSNGDSWIVPGWNESKQRAAWRQMTGRDRG